MKLLLNINMTYVKLDGKFIVEELITYRSSQPEEKKLFRNSESFGLHVYIIKMPSEELFCELYETL